MGTFSGVTCCGKNQTPGFSRCFLNAFSPSLEHFIVLQHAPLGFPLCRRPATTPRYSCAYILALDIICCTQKVAYLLGSGAVAAARRRHVFKERKFNVWCNRARRFSRFSYGPSLELELKACVLAEFEVPEVSELNSIRGTHCLWYVNLHTCGHDMGSPNNNSARIP